MALTLRPLALDRGSVQRACLIVEALLGVLGDDPRVQWTYTTWRRDHQLTKSFLQRLRRRRRDPDPTEQDVEDAQLFGARLLCDDPRDLARVQRLVHDQLGVAYPWLPPVLLCQFRVWAHHEATGDPLTLRVQLPPVTLAPGRAPVTSAAKLTDYVQWFYRHEIKQQRDTIATLAREAVGEQSRSDAHSKIQYGIARAKQLLAAVVLIEPPD